MKIDINSQTRKDLDSGTTSPGQDASSLSQLVRGVVKSCKAMSSYESACALILEMLEVVASDATALAELMRGKEEVRAFFEQRNTPQPSTNIEGCNVFMGGTHAEQFVGKNMKVDVLSPGNMIANNINKDQYE